MDAWSCKAPISIRSCPPVADHEWLPQVGFCAGRLGAVVGNGECCTLASEAIAAAGANPSTGYVFGATGGGGSPAIKTRTGEENGITAPLVGAEVLRMKIAEPAAELEAHRSPGAQVTGSARTCLLCKHLYWRI